MLTFKKLQPIILAIYLLLPVLSYSTVSPGCCRGMGGLSYCDSSAGRFVCRNGDYSVCYCRYTAVMDLQQVQGCCLWAGGILKKDFKTGAIICNNGSVSEICSAYSKPEEPWLVH